MASNARLDGPAQPRRVEIHLGPLCNNKCVFCVSSEARDDRDPWAPLDNVKRELEHFREQGCRALGLLGGEPTVYPWIEECVAHAKSLGYERIALCTNGTRFSDEAFCRRLADCGMTRVTISAHSHRAEIEDGLITLIPGNLERKLAAVKNLVGLREEGRLKDNVSLNPVLCRPTMGLMEEYLDFYAARGIDDVRFNYIWPEGAVGEDPAWIPRFGEAIPRILRVLLRAERRAVPRLSFGGVPKCVLRAPGLSDRLREHLAGKYLDEAAHDPDNDVSLVSGGSARRRPMRFVWQQMKRDNLKVRPESCRRCRHYERCEGVWKTYAKLYGTGELVPVETRAEPKSRLSRERVRRTAGRGAGRLLVVDATTRCNQDCAFCFEKHLHFTKPDMTLARARELARDAKEQGFASVIFIGGEPTLIPWLCEAIVEIKALGLAAGVTTNGVLLSSPRFAQRLMRAGPDHLELSLLADNAEDDLRLCGLPGGFEMRLKALARIDALRGVHPAGDRFCLGVNVVVNSVNAPRLEGLADLIAQRGADWATFKMLEVTPNIRDAALVPSLRSLAGPLAAAMRRLEAAGVEFCFDKIPLCAVAAEHRGRLLRRDEMAGAGHAYRRGGAGGGFDSETFAAEPAAAARCSGCALADRCPRPDPRYLALFGEGDLIPAGSAGGAS